MEDQLLSSLNSHLSSLSRHAQYVEHAVVGSDAVKLQAPARSHASQILQTPDVPHLEIFAVRLEVTRQLAQLPDLISNHRK